MYGKHEIGRPFWKQLNALKHFAIIFLCKCLISISETTALVYCLIGWGLMQKACVGIRKEEGKFLTAIADGLCSKHWYN